MQRVLISGLACSCALAAPAAAQVQLWNTGAWDTRDGRASDRTTPASRPQTRAADDFVLPAGNGRPYSLTTLRGRVLVKNYTGAFAEIYADASGVPAATPLHTLPAGSPLVLQTGVFGQYALVEYAINASGISLAPGRYWVSVVCDVSGAAPPNDGYGFFCTAGNQTVQGLQGYYRTGTGAWTPIVNALGYQTDFSFRLDGAQLPPPCYANCDNSTSAPILNILDFICFQGKFASGDTYANCDNSTSPPVLNVLDFICFQTRFGQGCP